MSETLSEEFIAFLKRITGKRSRVVIDHILQYGYITTEDLEITYGYNHPPRAIRDVRENGVPIETFRVKNAQGRTIAAYRFGDVTKLQYHKIGGRKTFPTKFKKQLYELAQGKCAICNTLYEARYLQIDHRIPYEVAGTTDDITRIEDYMLVCARCNRAKSWSCEHCANWQHQQDPLICKSCYWHNPTDYYHIATQPLRRVELVWLDDEIEVYDQLAKQAIEAGVAVPAYIKQALKRFLRNLETST
jgi:hypothetical protein